MLVSRNQCWELVMKMLSILEAWPKLFDRFRDMAVREVRIPLGHDARGVPELL
jgi:hypothetical protein